jgi:hydrogenase maturation protein HypF
LLQLGGELPPHSFIQSLETLWLAPTGAKGFAIRESESQEGSAKCAFILPDIATCPDCLREIFTPGNRRFGYPFTNCTHCGPRFSIISALPYDRANTSMGKFVMCEQCSREYEDPADRRFHAEPNACPNCGPRLEWWGPEGEVLASGDDEAMASAASAIAEGAVVAIKGLGGFHLVVDARSQNAVARLRERKHREEKPFAVMFPGLEAVLAECEVSAMETRLLLSPEAPIVLLRRKKAGSAIAPAIAPLNPFLGALLPYTPLHHLLLRRLGFPIVATSGNRSDEPICTDESEALERLGGIADFFLVHNRPILRHVDDSVARVVLGREMLLRRARGFAPLPIQIASAPETILALGAHLKNTIALSVGEAVFTSQHIGDLQSASALAAHHAATEDLPRLFNARPLTIAADAHPDYLSTRSAIERANAAGARLVSVQHHFAHVLSCMAENQIAPPALGVAWDGTGYGSDGTIWGGEFLVAGGFPEATDRAPSGFKRFAHLRPFSLPGGDAAAKEPRRSALGLLYEICGEAVFERKEILRAFSGPELKTLRGMLRQKLNSPSTTSMGRLFDAVAALLGLGDSSAFEGQTAMRLEWCVPSNAGPPSAAGDSYPFQVREAGGEAPLVLDWAPLVEALLADIASGAPVGSCADKFHNALVEMILQVARRSGQRHIVLTGGCFQNVELLTRAVRRLDQEGFVPVWHQRVPPNDGGIALGQVAAVAMQNEGSFNHQEHEKT